MLQTSCKLHVTNYLTNLCKYKVFPNIKNKVSINGEGMTLFYQAEDTIIYV